MSEEKKKLTAEENAKGAVDAGLVEILRVGATRRVPLLVKRGETIGFDSGASMVTKTNVIVDTEETYTYAHVQAKTGAYWKLTSYYLGSIREAPPSAWRRFWLWVARKPLPKAVLVHSKKAP